MGNYERYIPCGSEEDDVYFGGPDYDKPGSVAEEYGDPELWQGYEQWTPPPADPGTPTTQEARSA